MTQPETTAEAVTEIAAPRGRRTKFLIAGMLLWTLVFVFGIKMLSDHFTTTPPPAENSPLATAKSLTPIPVDPSAKTNADGTPLSAEPSWNPEGIDDFSLTECHGKTITKADLLGKPWAVCFIFTTCAGPCPRVTSQMYQLQKKLGDADVRLVSITVKPKTDTPEVLKRYAAQYGADPEKWLHLTGDQDDIYKLVLDSFLMPVQQTKGAARKPGFEVLHTTNMLHVDATGRVVKKYNALKDEDMIALRRALIAEADELAGKVSPESEPTAAENETIETDDSTPAESKPQPVKP